MMNELKDKVYELEGLLELQALRPEKSEELRHLIDGRIRDINALWKAAGGWEPGEQAAPVEQEAFVETVQEPEASIYSVPEDEADDMDGMDVTLSEERSVDMDFLEPEPVPEADPEPQEAPARPVPALCLNDRYRFVRVIGGGDRQMFDRMLRDLAGMADYDAARDYVLSHSHADSDDPEVMDFLEILQQYYE